MKRIMAAILILSVSSCTSLAGRTTSLKTNVGCHLADVGTTAVSLAKGNVEDNPLLNALKINSLGNVWGTVVPLAMVGVAAYYVLKAIHSPVLNAADSADVCLAAMQNVGVILK